MILTKENIYINLQGKSEEELTELKNILFEFKQNTFRRDIISYYYENKSKYNYFHFACNLWLADTEYDLVKEKTEITIEQLKEILKPMETLQQKEQRLIKELEEVRKEIEDSKIKVGDWVWNSFVKSFYKIMQEERKITNPQLIELLENESK